MKGGKLSPYKIMLEKCLAVRAGETVLIVTDKKKKPIANAILEEAKQIAKEVGLIEIEERAVEGEEPPEFVSAVMKKCNVAFLVTSKSMTHTNARRQATEIGVRIASLPGITDQIISRAIATDYDYMNRLNKKLAELLLKSESITVQSPRGTHIKFKMEPNRPIMSDSGLFHEEGAFGNLPAGETYLAPLENTVEGVVVVDGSVLGDFVDKPVRMEIKGGFVTGITGGKTAKKLLDTLTPLGKDASAMGEFGIGTNPKAKLTGNTLEDKKTIGTCHFALGNNLSAGGRVFSKSHIDAIIRKPTIMFDRKRVMHNGNFMLGKI